MEHPYDEIYLQEVSETQGALFERLQDVAPTKEDSPEVMPGNPLRGFAPNWMGQFYARYQWQTGELSSAIVDAIPPEWLCEAYLGLHDLDLAQAVEKVAKEICRNGSCYEK